MPSKTQSKYSPVHGAVRLIDFCIKGLKIPRVTNGEDLCKHSHESLMGRIYAKHATSYSGEVLCKADLHNLPRKCVHTRYMGRFYVRAIRGKPCNQSRFASNLPMYIPNHSTIMGGIYAKVTLGMYPLIERVRDRESHYYCMQCLKRETL